MHFRYQFNKNELKDAHKSCQRKARKAAQIGCHMIVIDNTNIKAWESKYYLDLTKAYNYTPLFIEPQTPWAMDPKQLAERNFHGVTEEVLVKKVILLTSSKYFFFLIPEWQKKKRNQ